MEDEVVTIAGLEGLLDDEETPYLDLHIAAGSRRVRAAVLVAGDEWAVNMKDERGSVLPGSGVYGGQAEAILAAVLTALQLGRTKDLRK